jgi:tetratricopeptide (TPR) repeat protein
MTKLAIAACVAASIFIMPRAFAQEHDHRHEEGNDLGEVSFPVSCNAQAQVRFNTAAALLYSFYWERVDAAVASVLDADPGCAMAYWAKAIASLDNPLGAPPTPQLEQAGWAAVEKAKQLGGKTARERDYIAAVETVFKDHATVPFKTRAAAYLKALEQLRARYPDDSEAAVHYAYWLQVTADRNDPTHAQQLQSARILEQVSMTHPRHPGVIHFLIHAYDFPAIAEQGLDAARRYAAIAPDSPHALHMPSHIFSRVGQWQDSIDMNVRSRAAAKADRDVYHALDYLTYASLQLGRDAQARKWVEFVQSNETFNEQTRQIAYAAAVIPARYTLERGEWKQAAQLALRPVGTAFDWSPFPEGEAVNAYARALGAARSGDAAAAKTEVARLGRLRDAMVAQHKDYWIEQADIQVDTIRAWIARAEGRNDEAVKLMRAAADREDQTEEHVMMPGRVIPVREMLGELLLELDHPVAALAAFEESQRGDPKRFRNTYGAARAAELAGKPDKARAHYEQLLQQVGPHATGRPEIEQARAFVARF